MLLLMGVVALWPAAATPQGGARITDHLYGTRFINADEGWAVGAFGSIFRTRDGGHTWRPQVSRTFEQLFSVDFTDHDHGWIVGRSGLILHTRNGGDTWETQASGSDRHLFKVAAISRERAWAIGDWGAILATRDGGKTWTNHSLTRDVILYGESWPDGEHGERGERGWIVGEAGAILMTSDGGATWTDQPSGVDKTLFGVFFADAQRGWATGLDGLILRTQDGGQTWQVQRGNPEVSELEQVGFAEALGNASLYDVAVAGALGYAVGDIGTVFVSTDGGATWARKDVPAEWSLKWIRDVSLASAGRGAFVGANGLAIRIDGDHIELPEKESHAAQTPH
jgi:photosystem II stability/assembly factor-like uncharacterized protein